MLEWDILSVYPYKEENIQEILCRIYSIVEELKKNGQVVPPELISDIEKIKEEFKVIKGQLGEELQKKIDEALKSLNAVVDKYKYSVPNGSNNITDPYINDYTQELTGGDYSWAYNDSEYGKFKLVVKNGNANINGVFNLAKINNTDYKTPTQVASEKPAYSQSIQIVQPIIASKQLYSKVNSVIAYNGSNNIKSLPIVLNKNGGLSIDTNTWKTEANDYNRYIGVDINFPIVKTYVKQNDKQSIDDKIKAISKLMRDKTSCVVVACDSHIRPTQYEYENLIDSDLNLYVPLWINYLNSRLGAFATINNGDTLHESLTVNTNEKAQWLMDSVRKMYLDNTLFVLGNHDDQSKVIQDGQQITMQQFNQFMNKGKTGITFAENNAPYFYSDDTEGQCRHICLNSHDREGKKIGIFEFSAGQLKWLINVLNNTPSSYSIVIYCHTSPKISPDQPNILNGDKLHVILKNFVKKSSGSIEISGETINFDFTACTSLLAGVVSGHEHEDRQQLIDGVNYFIFTSISAEYGVANLNYTVLLVNREHRKLTVVRGGSRPQNEYNF